MLTKIIRSKAFDNKSLVCKLLRNLGVGRLAFRLRVLFYKFDNRVLGRFNQRCIEYPWVLKMLKEGKSRLLLDVGCTGSLLDHELLARGFHVVGLDINDHVFRNKRQTFFKQNILNNNLPSEVFDVILAVSTIEHVGLDTYLQDIITEDGDYLAIKEFYRLLKPDGILVLTTNYEGKGRTYIHKGQELKERRYGSDRLSKLLENFEVVETSFYLCSIKHRCRFIQIEKFVLDKLPKDKCEGSLACLVLRKGHRLIP